MKIIRNPYWRDEELMMLTIKDLERRRLPSIGVFECNQLTRATQKGSKLRSPITSLSILPEDLHACVTVVSDPEDEGKEIVSIRFYQKVKESPDLVVLEDWCIYIPKGLTHLTEIAHRVSSRFAQFFFYYRDAFDDPVFVRDWDRVIYGSFSDTSDSLAVFLKHKQEEEQQNDQEDSTSDGSAGRDGSGAT